MKSKLRRVWERQQFNPDAFGTLFNPFYLARRALWRAMAEFAPMAHGRLLDVGCGTMPYRSLFRVDEYLGLELDTPAARARDFADAYYDGDRFPFADASFETVLCNQVLEHVFEPDGFVRELHRVLAPGGHLLLTVPFVWDEHEQPHDFARYSTFGLRALLERNGFVVIEQRRLLDGAGVLFQLANAYLYKVLRLRLRHWAMVTLATATVMAPLTVLGIVLGRLLPSNPDFYLDQAVVAVREAPPVGRQSTHRHPVSLPAAHE